MLIRGKFENDVGLENDIGRLPLVIMVNIPRCFSSVWHLYTPCLRLNFSSMASLFFHSKLLRECYNGFGSAMVIRVIGVELSCQGKSTAYDPRSA